MDSLPLLYTIYNPDSLVAALLILTVFFNFIYCSGDGAALQRGSRAQRAQGRAADAHANLTAKRKVYIMPRK